MKADDVILGIPTKRELIGDKEVELRQMAAGPSVRFAAEVAQLQLNLNKIISIYNRVDEVLQNPTDEGIKELLTIAEEAEKLDKGKIPLVKKMIGEGYEDEWILNNITRAPLLCLIAAQSSLNTIGLQIKNQEGPPHKSSQS